MDGSRSGLKLHREMGQLRNRRTVLRPRQDICSGSVQEHPHTLAAPVTTELVALCRFTFVIIPSP
jgi:hypothetical protein